ncbi:unnamed protein product [Plutella xylostella]|uniref:GPI ethanolamine phosphate transferase 1 n=1 Tax=Plutella xylostella TaxID=51655 RepID=A0A8S4ERB1_PLUXY|nr:unnamed protein product [Plutella xylostella]
MGYISHQSSDESRPGHVAVIAGFYEDPSAVAKGTDTSGHTHKPKSNDFLTTLRFVDEGIKVIEKIINDFYNDDGKTTFLMTSDHGMTDWAGVEQIPVLPDDHQEALPFDNRLDINQADLTPLMATAISVPVPVNSIGQLPVDLLSMSLPDKAKAIYSNARQLASQYDKKRSDVEQDAIAVLYQPYEPLDKRKYNEIIDHTQKLLEEKSYEKW